MRRRAMKKLAKRLDACGVREIASMQRYIDCLENCLWRLAMFTEGRDDPSMMIKFTERGSGTEFAVDTLFKFIKKNREKSD